MIWPRGNHRTAATRNVYKWTWTAKFSKVVAKQSSAGPRWAYVFALNQPNQPTSRTNDALKYISVVPSTDLNMRWLCQVDHPQSTVSIHMSSYVIICHMSYNIVALSFPYPYDLGSTNINHARLAVDENCNPEHQI